MLSVTLCEKEKEKEEKEKVQDKLVLEKNDIDEKETGADDTITVSSLRHISNSLGGRGSAKVRLSWTYYSTLSSSSSGGYFEFRPTDDGEWSTWASVFNEFRVDKLDLCWSFAVCVKDTNFKCPPMAIAYLPGRDSAPGNWAAMNDLSTSRIIAPSITRYNFVTSVKSPQMWDASSAVLYESGKWLNCASNSGIYSGRFYLYAADGFMQSATSQYLYIVGHMWVSFRKKK